MISFSERPVGVIYEHPRWYNPLFSELESRGIPFHKINPLYHAIDPSLSIKPYYFVYNDMSLSFYQNDYNKNLAGRIEYLSLLENLGVDVINGSVATALQASRAKQFLLLASLKIPFPLTRVVNHYDHALTAAKQIKFPLVVKTNYGSKGRVAYFSSLEEFEDALINGAYEFTPGNSIILQEYIQPKGNFIVRAETLNGKFQHAFKIHVVPETLNGYPIEVKREWVMPGDEIIKTVETIVQRGKIDVGSVEFLTDKQSGRVYFFDVNAHADYGIEVRNALGYDPYVRLVNFLDRRLQTTRQIELAI